MSKEEDWLTELREGFQSLTLQNKTQQDYLVRRTRMIVSRIFGDESIYLKDMEQINFDPTVNWVDMMREDYRLYWEAAQNSYINLISTMLEELDIIKSTSDIQIDEPDLQSESEQRSKEVFVVHGHDELMKQSVARTLESLGLVPVILHEQPNRGRTIIEKFMDHLAHASFAVVLLSPDDRVLENSQEPSTVRTRARQNVILELGIFLGAIGRSNVVVLHKQADNFEMPTDISGVLYTPFDDNGAWRFSLATELRAAGYEADSNLLAP